MIAQVIINSNVKTVSFIFSIIITFILSTLLNKKSNVIFIIKINIKIQLYIS